MHSPNVLTCPSFLQVFIAEIAQPQHRGWLCSLTMPIMALGTLISYSLGAAMSWHYVAVVGGCFPVVLMVALTFISDSPYWYMQQGDDKKACQVPILTLFFVFEKHIFQSFFNDTISKKQNI